MRNEKTPGIDRWVSIATAIVLLLMSYAAMTLYQRILGSSYDWDEVYTTRIITAPVYWLALGHAYDPGMPPAGFILLRLWGNIAGFGELSLRLVPMALFLISIGLWTRYVCKRFSAHHALLVTAAICTNGFLLSYAINLRPYTLLLASVIGFYVSFLSLLDTKHPSLLLWMTTIVIGTIALYSHYSSIVFLVVLIPITYILYPTPLHRKRIIISTITCILTFLPWITILIRKYTFPNTATDRYFFHQLLEGWIGFDGWVSVLTNGASEYVLTNPIRSSIAALAFFMFVGLAIRRAHHTQNRHERILLMFTAVTVTLMMFTPVRLILTEARYFIYLLPFLYLSIAVLIDAGRNRALLMAPILLLVAASTTRTNAYINSLGTDWKGIAAFATAKQPTAVLFDPCYQAMVYDYYDDGTVPVMCFSRNPQHYPYPVWDGSTHGSLILVKHSTGRGLDAEVYDRTVNQYHEITTTSYGMHDVVWFDMVRSE